MFGRLCSFSKGWFSGSMFVLLGAFIFASVLLGVAVNYLRLGLLIVSAVNLFDYGFFVLLLRNCQPSQRWSALHHAAHKACWLGQGVRVFQDGTWWFIWASFLSANVGRHFHPMSRHVCLDASPKTILSIVLLTVDECCWQNLCTSVDMVNMTVYGSMYDYVL